MESIVYGWWCRTEILVVRVATKLCESQVRSSLLVDSCVYPLFHPWGMTGIRLGCSWLSLYLLRHVFLKAALLRQTQQMWVTVWVLSLLASATASNTNSDTSALIWEFGVRTNCIMTIFQDICSPYAPKIMCYPIVLSLYCWIEYRQYSHHIWTLCSTGIHTCVTLMCCFWLS